MDIIENSEGSLICVFYYGDIFERLWVELERMLSFLREYGVMLRVLEQNREENVFCLMYIREQRYFIIEVGIRLFFILIYVQEKGVEWFIE